MPKKLTQEEFCERVRVYTDDTVEVISEYKNKRTPVEIKCKKCGHIWTFSPSNLCPSSEQKHKFQGCPECLYEEVECQYCHKKIKRLKSIIAKNNGINYCSRECGNKDKNEKRLNSFDSTNYRRNAFKLYPNKCCICGYDEEIQILEVHHLDEDRSNNNINNLRILCPNCHKKITLHLYSFEELFNNKY